MGGSRVVNDDREPAGIPSKNPFAVKAEFDIEHAGFEICD